MKIFKMLVHIDADGDLRQSVQTGLPEGDVDLVLTIKPIVSENAGESPEEDSENQEPIE